MQMQMNVRQLASVNAQHAAEDVSGKYHFVSTSRILDTLAERGWVPVSGYEKRANKDKYRGFQKHMIRLRKESRSMQVGDALVELILVNAHNRDSAVYLGAGVHRLTCSNGAHVSIGKESNHRIRHVGYATNKVDQALEKIEELITPIHAQIQRWREIELTDAQCEAFATQAIDLRWGNKQPAHIFPKMLLRVRRTGDAQQNLWTVFNVVQENLLRGTTYVGPRIWGRRRVRATIRPITGLDQNITLNKELWELATFFEQVLTWKGE
jgi:hypothetical protein